MAKTENTRRKLKPVIEKKRRDRINQNLETLRALLFRGTADMRLQNPKLEKTEILDLAVQYIQKNACKRADKKVSATHANLETTETQTKAPQPVFEAHIHQCVSELTSFMGQMHPSEQEAVFQSLEYYLNSRHDCYARTRRERNTNSADCLTKLCSSTSLHHFNQDPTFLESLLLGYKSNNQNILFTPLSLTEPLSPPLSPVFSSSSSSFSTSPPCSSSVPCHLPFAHSVSPPSSKCPLSIFAVPFSVCSSLNVPQVLPTNGSRDLPTPPTPSLNMRGELLPAESQSTWRPWN